MSVVPNGLPMPELAQHAPGARGAVIGTLARINPDKKLEQLIAAFELASARRPELELLVGGAPDKGHEDYAEALRKRPRTCASAGWAMSSPRRCSIASRCS